MESEHNTALDGNNNTTKPVYAIDGLSTTAEKTEPTISPQIITQSKTSIDSVWKPVSLPPTDFLMLEDESAKPQFTVQVLQQNWTRDCMFRFVDEGDCVNENGAGGMEMEWVIWKWALK